MTKSVITVLVSFALSWGLSVSPAHAVVQDDFESYNIGDTANVAHPGVYTSLNASTPIGSIANGVSTANVASSQVLEHNSAGSMCTRVNGSDLVGDATVSFDFLVVSGTHNIWFRDETNRREAILIRCIEIGASAPGRYYLQVQGDSGSNPPAFLDVVNYGEWIRATVNLHIDANNPDQSSFEIGFLNLTTNSPLSPDVGDGSSGMFMGTPISLVNQLQLESPSTGRIQLDNITVPEPSSLALIPLWVGGVMWMRRRVK
ncbi:MAG TPA: PEP-CTERM sorting domain-containing protein [Phycisphaeraceae bacterium]